MVFQDVREKVIYIWLKVVIDKTDRPKKLKKLALLVAIQRISTAGY